MKVGVLINDFDSFVATQTTAMLVHQFANLGHETYVFHVLSFEYEFYTSMKARARLATCSEHETVHDVTPRLKQSEEVVCP